MQDNGTVLNDLRLADDIDLIGGFEKELQLGANNNTRNRARAYCREISKGKSKGMVSSCQVNIQMNGQQLEKVISFELGLLGYDHQNYRGKLLRRNKGSKDLIVYGRHGKAKADMENQQHFHATKFKLLKIRALAMLRT